MTITDLRGASDLTDINDLRDMTGRHMRSILASLSGVEWCNNTKCHNYQPN